MAVLHSVVGWSIRSEEEEEKGAGFVTGSMRQSKLLPPSSPWKEQGTTMASLTVGVYGSVGGVVCMSIDDIISRHLSEGKKGFFL